MKNQITIDQLFNNLGRSGPELITRKKFAEMSGGLLTEKTLANLDCLGEGILPRFRVGGKVVYPTNAAILWLKSRAKSF